MLICISIQRHFFVNCGWHLINLNVGVALAGCIEFKLKLAAVVRLPGCLIMRRENATHVQILLLQLLTVISSCWLCLPFGTCVYLKWISNRTLLKQFQEAPSHLFKQNGDRGLGNNDGCRHNNWYKFVYGILEIGNIQKFKKKMFLYFLCGKGKTYIIILRNS